MAGMVWAAMLATHEASAEVPPAAGAGYGEWPQNAENPYRIKITIPLWSDDAYRNDKGGLVIHDVTGDGLMDYVISFKEGRQNDESGDAYIGAYGHHGEELWYRVAMQVSDAYSVK